MVPEDFFHKMWNTVSNKEIGITHGKIQRSEDSSLSKSQQIIYTPED